jgi:hypothetical protein
MSTLDPNNYECSMCLEPLVGPYSIGCGHTVCAQCFSRLTSQQCPLCRFNFRDGDKYGINIVLDKLLASIIPDYEARRSAQDKYIKTISIARTYRRSIRYHNVRSKIKQYFVENGDCCLLQVLVDSVCSSLATDDVRASEVYYHLDRMECAKITAESKDLVIYVNGCNDILPLLQSKVDVLSDALIIEALYYMYDIEELDVIGKKPPDRVFLEDKSSVTDMLLALESLPPRPNNDGDSDDSFDDSDDSDDSSDY